MGVFSEKGCFVSSDSCVTVPRCKPHPILIPHGLKHAETKHNSLQQGVFAITFIATQIKSHSFCDTRYRYENMKPHVQCPPSEYTACTYKYVDVP